MNLQLAREKFCVSFFLDSTFLKIFEKIQKCLRILTEKRKGIQKEGKEVN